MLSKNKLKLIRSLGKKKFREELQLFLVEGEKMAAELLELPPDSPFHVQEIYATAPWIEAQASSSAHPVPPMVEISRKELEQASGLVSPQAVLALVKIPVYHFDPESLTGETVLAFEAIRDPGNLGTIMRTADWFGIRHILCSPDSVDCFNPKVVQSSMGAFLRVQVHYTDLEKAVAERAWRTKPVYGTLLKGENLYEAELDRAPLVIFGNEARGLSPRLRPLVAKALTIPSFSPDGIASESLNLASSVAVVCSELRRTIRSGS